MIGLIGLAAALGFQGDSAHLNLDQALDLAYKNSFSIKTALSNYKKVHQQVNQAKASLGPRVTLGATETLYSPGIPVGYSQSGIITNNDSKVGTAGISLPVDLSGSIRKAISGAVAAENGALDTVEAAKNDLRRDVRKAYYRVLQAQEVVKVDEQAVASAEQRLKDTNAQLVAGTVAKVDLLRAEVQSSSAQIQLRTDRNNLDLAKQVFNNTLSRPIQLPVELAPVSDLPKLQGQEDDLVNTALASRHDLLGLRENAIVLSLATEVAKSGLLPSLNLSAQYQRTIQPPAGTVAGQTVGVISFSWPIFDSGATRAKIEQSRQDEAQMQIGIDQASLGISLEVRSAIKNLQSASDRLKIAEDQVVLALEAFRLANVRRNAGEGILVEVLDAQTALTQAQTGDVSARYDYLSAFADLQRALGVDELKQTNSGEKR